MFLINVVSLGKINSWWELFYQKINKREVFVLGDTSIYKVLVIYSEKWEFGSQNPYKIARYNGKLLIPAVGK